LQFSYGVSPVYLPERSPSWNTFASQWVQSEGLTGGLAVLAEGPTRDNPKSNHRLEIIELSLNRILDKSRNKA